MTVAVEATVVRVIICADARPTLTNGINGINCINGYIYILHGQQCITIHQSGTQGLLKEGVSMKQIQEWLGHSDISTTANIYAHLDSQSKNLSARTMANTLTLPKATSVKEW